MATSMVMGVGTRAARPDPSSEGDLSVRERRLAVALLCDEIAHELASPLTFLRDILVAGGALDAIDRSIGEEEVARLETIIAHLRRTRRAELDVAPSLLSPLVLRAAARVQAEVPAAVIAIDVPADLQLTAGEEEIELLLLSLLRNAVAVGAARVRGAGSEGQGYFEVEDDGPGLPADREETLFHPLTTLGPGGAGMGLPMALRIARDHGFRLAHRRDEGRTVFRVSWEEP